MFIKEKRKRQTLIHKTQHRKIKQTARTLPKTGANMWYAAFQRWVVAGNILKNI